MGRETVAVCHWEDIVAEVQLHLDSQTLQLRGDLRLDLPRSAIADVVLVDGGIEVKTDGPMLLVELDTVNAKRWQTALLKKPPTLTQKLGVSDKAPAFVLGAFDDASLLEAVSGARVSDPAEAAILIAVLLEPAALAAASDLALAHPDKHIWMVHEKGKTARVGDAVVRSHMRGLGFIDSKTSAISAQLTTTRYRLRSG